MHPISSKNRSIIITICLAAVSGIILSCPAQAGDSVPENRWEKDIKRFEAWDNQNAWPDRPVLFAGSSSIRMWKTRLSFPGEPVLNRGFGGSQISDVLHFLPRIVLPYRPRVIAFYCGDNDIAAGKAAPRVLADYREFVKQVHLKLPHTKIVFITIKPSGARWRLWPEMNRANEMIREFSQRDPRLYYADCATCLLGPDGKPDNTLFMKDRLHLNPAGYKKWTTVLKPILKTMSSPPTPKKS